MKDKLILAAIPIAVMASLIGVTASKTIPAGFSTAVGITIISLLSLTDKQAGAWTKTLITIGIAADLFLKIGNNWIGWLIIAVMIIPISISFYKAGSLLNRNNETTDQVDHDFPCKVEEDNKS